MVLRRLMLLYFALGAPELSANCLYANWAAVAGRDRVVTVKGDVEIPEELRGRVSGGARVRFLGQEQGGGGKVYLIEAEGQRSYVLKVYNDKALASWDVDRLGSLREVLADGGKDLGSFAVVGSERLGPQLLQLEYIPGRTLKDVLADPDVPEDVKAQLKAQRKLCLVNLGNAFVAKYGKRQVSGVGGPNLTIYRSGSQYDLDLWLKDDNILVDPGGRLVIIDPY